MFVYFFFFWYRLKTSATCSSFFFIIFSFLSTFFCCVYKIIIMCGIDPVKVPLLPHMFLSFHGDEKKKFDSERNFLHPQSLFPTTPIYLSLVNYTKKKFPLFVRLFILFQFFFIFHSRFQIVRSYNLSCLITFYVLAY